MEEVLEAALALRSIAADPHIVCGVEATAADETQRRREWRAVGMCMNASVARQRVREPRA